MLKHKHKDDQLDHLSKQIEDIRRSLQGVDGSISSLNMLYDEIKHHMLYENGCYHHVGDSIRHPLHISVEDRRKMMYKLIDISNKSYTKRYRVKVPLDARSKRGAIYFLDIPVGLTESCVKKQHRIDSYESEDSISKDIFFELLNNCKHTLLKPQDFTLSRPIPIHHKHYNTEIILSPVKTSNYTGDIVLKYNRTPISRVFQNHIRLNDTTSKTISELVYKLDLPLLSSDYIDQTLPEYDEDFPFATRKVTIKANENSLLYCDHVVVDLSYREIYFNPDGSIDEGENHSPTEMEKLPNKDIIVIKDNGDETSSIFIYRDNTPHGDITYTRDDAIVPLENVTEPIENLPIIIAETNRPIILENGQWIYTDDGSGIGTGEGGDVEYPDVITTRTFKVTSIFRINADRYALYGEFNLFYKDRNDNVIYYNGNSLLVNRDFRVIRGENNLFNSTEYNPKTMIVTSDLRVVTIAKENEVYTIYWFCSYGHMLTSVSIQKDSSIVPIRLFKANDGNIYVIGETIDKTYKIYKIDYTGSLAPYRDESGNIIPFEPIEVTCSNPNINPPDIIDIKDDLNNETYILFRPVSSYSILSPYPLIEDERYFVDNTSVTSSWNPVRKFNILGMMKRSFKTYLPYVSPEVVSTIKESDILEDSLDTRLSTNYKQPRISFFTRKINPVTGIESFDFTVLDTDGNNITNKYTNFSNVVISKIYGIYKLTDNRTSISCLLYKDPNNEVVNKDAIIIYDENYIIRNITYIKVVDAIEVA